MDNDTTPAKVRLTDGLGAGTEAPWVCPWGICSYHDAQHCRSLNGTTKMTRGCGNYFPPGTTLEQAKQMIGPRP